MRWYLGQSVCLRLLQAIAPWNRRLLTTCILLSKKKFRMEMPECIWYAVEGMAAVEGAATIADSGEDAQGITARGTGDTFPLPDSACMVFTGRDGGAMDHHIGAAIIPIRIMEGILPPIMDT